MSLRCWASAGLNDCANGDEADLTFVQTQKMQCLYYYHFIHIRICENIFSQSDSFQANRQVAVLQIYRHLDFWVTNCKFLIWNYFYFFFYTYRLLPRPTIPTSSPVSQFYMRWEKLGNLGNVGLGALVRQQNHFSHERWWFSSPG